jgi:ATP-dependent DNA helicase RecQ
LFEQEAKALLLQYWGHKEFRGQQLQAIYDVVNGNDVLFLAPTSLGKSVVFQVSALMTEGMAIVVSPLIALMTDQINSLELKGIQSITVNSTLGVKARREALQKIRDGTIKILYVAPETLMTTDMLELLQTIKVSFIAFDEAHCISSYGHDFRKAYKAVKDIRQVLPVNVIALTATADPNTKMDIHNVLQLYNCKYYEHSFDRPSIYYGCYLKTSDINYKIYRIIKTYPPETTGIVYCYTKDSTLELAKYLQSMGITAEPYNASLKTSDKNDILQRWLNDETKVICATIAFGMGIDKSSVRYVIHADLPTSLEGWAQEVGRAARDGQPATSYLFYSAADYNKHKFIAKQNSKNPESYNRKLQKLSKMYSFASSNVCRRQQILAYFGQKLESNNCGNCDICRPTIMRY